MHRQVITCRNCSDREPDCGAECRGQWCHEDSTTGTKLNLKIWTILFQLYSMLRNVTTCTKLCDIFFFFTAKRAVKKNTVSKICNFTN